MDDNGILGAIPGEFIAQASKGLPNPETATEQRVSATVDTTATWRGLVRITFERTPHRRAKHTWWSWVAVHAERVE